MVQTPRTEFAQALRAIASERKLDVDVILDTIKQAIVAAYKRDAKESEEEIEGLVFDVELDPVTGGAKVFAWPEEKPEEKKEVTPPGFGRIAAQTAKQVIHQKIREAEKGAIMEEYASRVGSLISGMILRFDGPDVRVDLGRSEGLMLSDERVSSERLNPNQRLTFLLKEIKETLRGKQIILSRTDAVFVQKLFEREVPEMNSGSVEVKGISREAGVRTKIAVFSNQSGVDPVGSCVGQKGVRVQAVTNELGGERVDIVPWSEDLPDYIKAALSPAEGLTVTLDEDTKIAKVKAPEDQLSLAIGKDGQNARLAAKLTGWKVEIEELEGEEGKKKKVEEVEKVVKAGEVEKKKSGKEGKEKKEPKSGEEKAEKKESATKTQKKAKTKKSKKKQKNNGGDKKSDGNDKKPDAKKKHSKKESKKPKENKAEKLKADDSEPRNKRDN